MSALEKAKKMTKEEVLEKIASSGLKEYGVYTDSVIDRWNLILDSRKEELVEQDLVLVVALNNADTTGVLLEVLKKDPDKVFAGMNIAAYALDAEKKVLQIPEYAGNLVEKIQEKADAAGVVVAVGLVNVRAAKYSIISHMVTMMEINDLFDDNYYEGVYVSVNGGVCKKYDASLKVMDILKDADVDVSDIKAIETGYEFSNEAVLEKTIAEAKIINGVCNVLTSKDCIVKKVEKLAEISRRQSCGKCVFCREGLIQIHRMIRAITEGKGKADTEDIIKEISSAMTFSTPCSMGQVSAKAALSSIELFGEEYEEHIKKKTCSAGMCFSKKVTYIDPQLCEGCEECVDMCPMDCIEGKKKFIHMIDEFDCTQCGKCMEVCEYDAIIQTSGKVPKLPDKLIKCGKFKKH